MFAKKCPACLEPMRGKTERSSYIFILTNNKGVVKKNVYTRNIGYVAA